MDLRPCPKCRRHANANGADCPFCGATLGAVARAGASAVMLAGLMAVSGCDKQGGSSADEPDPKAASGKTTKDKPVVDEPADIYGGPPMNEEPKPEQDPKPQADSGDSSAPVPDEPVRAIYAGPPPREPAEPPKAEPEP